MEGGIRRVILFLGSEAKYAEGKPHFTSLDFLGAERIAKNIVLSVHFDC